MLSQENASAKEAPPRLLVDAMHGRLARWLRLMGYDAEYFGAGSDDAAIARARAEDRLIVTGDRQLAGRRGVAALLVTAAALDEQLAEVRAAVGGRTAPFSRCAECNGVLAELSPVDACGAVPPYVWHTQTTFRRCPGCGRVYWQGTHWPALRAKVLALLGDEAAL